MIFDRRRIYLIGAAVALLVLALVYFSRPQITPEQRVREQLALLAHEPWILVRIREVQPAGSRPEQVLLHGERLDDGTPVVISFVTTSPYTSPATMQRLREQDLAGRVSEVLMVPRSLAEEPYRSQVQTSATHVGVGFFAGLPEWTAKAKAEPAETAPEAAGEAPMSPPSAPADTSAAPPPAGGHQG